MNEHQAKWPIETPRNIIVRMPNWLGDAVMATPILADLRTAYPNASITAMCQHNIASLLRFDPAINELFAFKKPSGWLHRRQHWKIIKPLRQGEYDLGVLLTNSFSSAWWFWRGEVRNRLGFSSWVRSWLLDKAVPFSEKREEQHLVLTYKELLAPLGIAPSSTLPKLYLKEEERQSAYGVLLRYGYIQGERPLIGINPGAAYGSAKCWPKERFSDLTKRLLAELECHVVYFGDEAGKPLVDEICSEFNEGVINLAGKTTIRELMALLSCCSLLLTNDSGPMHMAAALGVPLLALFGSTSEVKTGPCPKGEVIHKHVSCSPCYKRICPIDFRCMKRIEVDEVFEKLQKLLKP